MKGIILFIAAILFTGCTYTSSSGTTYRWPATDPNIDYSKYKDDKYSLSGRSNRFFGLLFKEEIIKASRDGNKNKLMQILSKQPEKINISDPNGDTPLIWSSWKGHSEIVEALIIYGADINLKDKTGQTALHLASGYGHIEIVDLLLKSGAKIDAKTNKNKTSLMYAIRYPTVVQKLLSHGANFNISSISGSALTIAEKEYDRYDLSATQKTNIQNTIKLLRDKGAFRHNSLMGKHVVRNFSELRKTPSFKIDAPKWHTATIHQFIKESRGYTVKNSNSNFPPQYLFKLHIFHKPYKLGYLGRDFLIVPKNDKRRFFIAEITILDLDTKEKILTSRKKGVVYGDSEDTYKKNGVVWEAIHSLLK